MASLHILFNLAVEMDAVWAAVLETENSSEVKPTVQTRYLQGSRVIGRDSISAELGMSSPAWYQACKPCRGAAFTHWCTASHRHSSAAPDPAATAVWTNRGLSLFAMLLLTARCWRYGLNFIFPDGPEIQKATY